MDIVEILIGTFLFLGSFVRIGLNAHIYNGLHQTNKRLFVTKEEPGGGEDESIESALFMMYCLLIIVWIRYRNDLVGYAIFSNILGVLSLAALIFMLLR